MSANKCKCQDLLCHSRPVTMWEENDCTEAEHLQRLRRVYVIVLVHERQRSMIKKRELLQVAETRSLKAQYSMSAFGAY